MRIPLLLALAASLLSGGCGARRPPAGPAVPAAAAPSSGAPSSTTAERVAEGDAARAAGRHEEALAAYEAASLADMASFDAAWRAARACAELLDATWDARSRDDRILLAQRGVNHAERAKSIAGDRPDGFYFAAACYGLLGKAKGLGGKKTIDPILENAGRAVAIDEAYESAGGHRILGALYLKAPPWPTSVGDLDRSRAELEAACRVAPDEPVNHLLLARALQDLGEAEAARAERARFEALAPADPSSWPRFWREELAALRP